MWTSLSSVLGNIPEKYYSKFSEIKFLVRVNKQKNYMCNVHIKDRHVISLIDDLEIARYYDIFRVEVYITCMNKVKLIPIIMSK